VSDFPFSIDAITSLAYPTPNFSYPTPDPAYPTSNLASFTPEFNPFDFSFGESSGLGGDVCIADIDEFFRAFNDVSDAIDEDPDAMGFPVKPFEGQQEDCHFPSTEGLVWLCDTESY
jgi:hypothetical protein